MIAFINMSLGLPLFIFIALCIVYICILFRKNNNTLDITDIRVIFIGLLFFYGSSVPLASFLGSEVFFVIDTDVLVKSIWLHNIAVIGLILSSLFASNPKAEEMRPSFAVHKTWAHSGIMFLGLGFVMLFIHYQRLEGVLEAIAMGRVTHLATAAALRGNLPYPMFFFAGFLLLSIYVVNSKKQNFSPKAILFAVAFLWILINLFLGSRREILFLGIIFVGAISSKYKIILNRKVLVCILLSYFAFSAVGHMRWGFVLAVRERSWQYIHLAIQDMPPMWFIPASGEFAAPFYTLHETLRLDLFRDVPMGATYLQALPNLLPRSLYPGVKPIPISGLFAITEHQGVGIPVGYGFSPVTEAYINFGWGLTVVFLTFGLLMNWFVKIKRRNSLSFLIYCCALLLAFNLNRIDFSSSFMHVVYLAIVAVIAYMWALIIGASRYSQKTKSLPKYKFEVD